MHGHRPVEQRVQPGPTYWSRSHLLGRPTKEHTYGAGPLAHFRDVRNPLPMMLDKHALLGRYSDEAWRSRYLEVTALVSLLHNSIIDDSYKPSDELNAAIALAPAGDKLMLHLQRRESVPVKEARLLCLLVTAHTDPLVDVERIDLDRLSAAISRGVIAGHLRYPYIYGRGLYDRFADQHEEERPYLNLDETLSLLEKPAYRRVPGAELASRAIRAGPESSLKTPPCRSATAAEALR